MDKTAKQNKVINKIQDTIKKRLALTDNPHFVLMVSGGCDSTALTHIMSMIYGSENCTICHINHKLRDQADADQSFVEYLGKSLGIKVFAKAFDVKNIANKQNIEQTARTIRYSYAQQVIEQIAKSNQANMSRIYLVTAHTQNDRAENFYMRSIVGTGPGGFIGMRYQTDNLIRPLLDISRTELEDYMNSLKNPFTDSNGNRWTTDSTNFDTTKFRAFIRHNVLPLMEQCNPEMLNNLTRSMNLVAQENDFMITLTDNILNNHFTISEHSFIISTSLKAEPDVLQKRAIYYSFRQIFGQDSRINNSSIEAVIQALNTVNYKNNIQKNYAVHSTKRQVFVEPMKAWQQKRNRI